MSLQLDNQLSQALYTSVPISRGLGRIRLLRLHPGVGSEPLTGNLHEVYLDDPPPYKALSYAWINNGSASPASSEQQLIETIRCNGVAMLVSPNLHAALLRLRDPREDMQLWVDSICINQKDMHERSDQVSRMRDIYRMSSEVVIWLGARGENDDLGEDLLGQTATNGIDWCGDDRDRDKWEGFVTRQKTRQKSFDVQRSDVFGAFCVLWLLAIEVKASEIVHLRHISESTGLINGLQRIMDQSWWRRSWVVQETVVASMATVYYANLSAPWTMFAQAAIAYSTGRLATSVDSVYPYLRPLVKFARAITEVEGTRRTWNDTKRLTTLLPLLRLFRPRSATDPRDKVFALLGLAQYWGGNPKIVADYSVSPEKVFWFTAITMIRMTRNLDVLMGTLNRRDGSRFSNVSASWITDWSCRPDVNENTRVSLARFYDAAKHVIPRPVMVHGQSILEVHGCDFDEVAFVASELPLAEDGEVGRWRAVVREWEKCLGRLGDPDDKYVSGGTIADAFWRTLCGDIENGRDPQSGQAGFRRITDSLADVYTEWRTVDTSRKRRTSIIAGYWQENGGEVDEATESRNTFHHTVECASGWRRFFITKRGFIGSGPRDVSAGDRIFVIHGSRVPFILRSTRSVTLCRRELLQELIGLPQPGFIAAGSQAKGKLRSQGGFCTAVHTNCFSVVGDAYVHGIMDGQITSILGDDVGRNTGTIYLT